MNKHYVNLTNGIEAIEEIKKLKEPISFIRICSTTVERKDYIKLFSDLDHDLLLHCALGYNCHIYDFGTNRVMSKTCYFAIPFINYVLNRYWYDLDETYVRIGRNGSITTEIYNTYFEKCYTFLFHFDSNKEKEFMKTKLKYYKKFLNSDRVILTPHSKSTIHDGKYEFYKETLIKNY